LIAGLPDRHFTGMPAGVDAGKRPQRPVIVTRSIAQKTVQLVACLLIQYLNIRAELPFK
jgi:hypothetical protein